MAFAQADIPVAHAPCGGQGTWSSTRPSRNHAELVWCDLGKETGGVPNSFRVCGRVQSIAVLASDSSLLGFRGGGAGGSCVLGMLIRLGAHA